MRLRRLAAVVCCVAFIGCDNGAPTAPSAPSDAPGATVAPPASEMKPEKGKKGEVNANRVSGTVD